MKPMTIEEAKAKKVFLSKLYFTVSLATFVTVLYQVKQGRLNWLESEGLIPEDEMKLSPGKSTNMMMMIIIIIQVMMLINCFFFFLTSLPICQDVGR